MYTTFQNTIKSIFTQSLNRGLLFLILTLLSFFAHKTSAQQFYPVRVQPQVSVPSVYISDYTDPFNFRVKVALNDLTKVNYRIRLYVEIKGSSNLNIRSINPLYLTLNGGEVYFLNRQDLMQLLAPTNLQGLPTGAILSEGAYTFAFEAFDALVEPPLRVSNIRTDFTQAMLMLNQPPLLNQPANRTEFDLSRQGQNIFFSWTPRSFISSPNQRVKYELRIVKLEPIDRNPYEALQAGGFMINNRPFDDLDYPSFIYDRSQFMLEEGAVYAWQIRAYEEITVNGTLQKSSARFHQGGLSEAFTFSVKENCFDIKPIEIPKIEVDPISGEDLIALRWQEQIGHQKYEVKYRPLGATIPWTVVQTDRPELLLGKEALERGITYEYSVAARCRIWLPAVYGGTFKLEKPDCEAPEPILIKHNNVASLALEWEASEGANAYRIRYTRLPGTEEVQVDNHSPLEIELPALDEQSSYRIAIDALCANKTAEGNEQIIAHDDKGFIGDCPMPAPFRLMAQRSTAVQAHPLDAALQWSSHALHKGYVLEYWHRDSSDHVRSIANDQPFGTAIKIVTKQVYEYTLRFECGDGKTATSPVGIFIIDSEGLDDTGVSGAVTCLPPGQKSAEARSVTEAFFDWNKVRESDEYQLFYAPYGTEDYKTFNTTASNAKIRELVSQGKYHYKIRCRCGTEYSVFTDLGMVDLSQPTKNNDCSPAPWFTAYNTTRNEMQLAWPYENTKTGYTLYYKQNSQPWSQQHTVSLQDMDLLRSKYLKNDTLKYTVTGLKSATTYDFKLQATCGTQTAQANQTIGWATCDLPLKEQVTAVAQTLNSVSVKWITEKYFNDYVFRYRELGQGPFREVASKEANILLKDLHFEKMYEYQIIYYCVTGKKVSGAFNTFKISIPDDLKDRDRGTGDCFPPENIKHLADITSATISWPKDKEVGDFVVYWRVKNTASAWDSLTTAKLVAEIKDLSPETTYEYKVRAICKKGGLSIPSGIFEFVTEDKASAKNCEPPILMNHTHIDGNEVKLSWEKQDSHTGYLVEYKKTDSPIWMEIKAQTNEVLVSSLMLATSYDYRVAAHCGLKQSVFTPIDTFNTGLPPEEFSCGDGSGLVNITNRTPIASLQKGDMFTAADFMLEVNSLTSGSPYNGEAIVTIPYLKHSSFKFGMENVQINELNQMFAGRVYFKGAHASVIDPELAAELQNMLDMVDRGFSTFQEYLDRVEELQDDINAYIMSVEGGNNVGFVKTGDVEATTSLNIEISDASQIDGASSGTGCKLTITADDGSTQTKDVPAPSTLKDSQGNIFVIDDKCSVTKVAEQIVLSTTPAELDNLSSLAVVTFTDHPLQKYGFSAWDPVYNKSDDWAKRYQLLSNNYRVPAKSIEPAAADVVKATIGSNNLDKSKIIFSTGKGVKFASKVSGNDFEITVVGGPDGDAQELYALYEESTGKYVSLGKLLIAGYKLKKRKLVLVPVNGTSVPEREIKQKLNEIYNLYSVDFEVVTDADFTDMSWDLNGDMKLQVEGSGKLTTLTAEMKALNEAYRNNRNVEQTSIYIFVMSSAESPNIAGDMPRAKQFGYVFTQMSENINYSNTEIALTAAHEVGHGLFLLRHPFSGYGFSENDIPANLMDYTSGDKLAKIQWDIMHDPGIVLGVFERDEDQHRVIITDWNKLTRFEKDGWLTFVSPAGVPISLELSKLTMLEFATFGDVFQGTDIPYSTGVLTAFEYDNVLHRSIKSGTQFRGYGVSTDQPKFIENFSQQKKYSYILGGFLCLENSQVVFKVFPLTNYVYSKDISVSNNGSGEFIQPDDLKDYIGDESTAEKVWAKFLNEEHVDKAGFFLRYGRSDICGIESYYAFKIVHFLKQNTEYQICMDDIGKEASGNIREGASSSAWDIISELDKEDQNEFEAASLNVNTVASVEKHKHYYEQEYDRIAEISYMKFYYEQLMSFHEVIKEKKQSRNIDLSNSSISTLINFFEIQSKAIRFCLLRQLDINLRIALLNKSNNWGSIFNNKKEALMLDLIQTTPKSDLNRLYEELKGDLFLKLFNDCNGSDFDRLVSLLTALVYEKYDVQNLKTFIQPEFEVSATNSLSEPDPYLTIYKFSRTDNGEGIVLLKNTTRSYSNNKIRITSQVRISRNNVAGSDYITKVRDNPLTLVLVQFDTDFQILGPDNERINTSYVYKVPLIWLYWFVDNQTGIERSAAFRIALTTGATIASVLTMEPGPLLAAELILGGAEISITLQEDEILSRNDRNERMLLEQYQTISNVLGLGQFANGVCTLSKSSLGTKIREMNFDLPSLKGISTSIRGIYSQTINTAKRGWKGYDLWSTFMTNMYLEAEIYQFYKRTGSSNDLYKLSVGQSNQLAIEFLAKNGTSVKRSGTIANIYGDINSEMLYIRDAVTYNSTLHGAKSKGQLIGELNDVFELQSDGSYLLRRYNVFESPTGLFYVLPKTTKFNDYKNIENWINTFDDAIYGNLISKLDGLDAVALSKLNNYLNGATVTFKTTLKQPGALDAWKLIDKAIDNNDITKFAKDPRTLEKLTEMMQTNSAFRQKLGSSWENKLSELLGKHNHLRCSTCGNTGLKAAPEMHEFLSDIEHFYVNFNQNGKANKFFNWLNRQTAGAGDAADIATNNANTSLAEMYQTLKQLRKNGIKEADVEKFGASYSNLPNSRQSDILLNNGKHIELKNKPYAIDGTFTEQEIDQVIGAKGAFGNIDKLDDFEWIAELSRGNNETNLKNMWKTVFSNKKTEIFEVMGTQLRESILGTGNANRFDLFEQAINNLDSNLYKFIQAQ